MWIGINQDPTYAGEEAGGECDRFFRVLTDVNYNVIGLVDAGGRLVERYEYTPYGQRTETADCRPRGLVSGRGGLFWP